MDKYIDADKAILEIEKHLRTGDELYPLSFGEKCINEGLEVAASVVNGIPAADVAEVKMGHWTKLLTAIGEHFECSECGEIVSDAVMGQPRFKFCPMCGARMDEAEK